MARLIDGTGRIYQLGSGPTVLGRSGADIAFVDSSVAAQQARITVVDGVYRIEDLAGTTLLNRRSINGPHALRNGDTISFGRRTLRVDGITVASQDVPARGEGATGKEPAALEKLGRKTGAGPGFQDLPVGADSDARKPARDSRQRSRSSETRKIAVTRKTARTWDDMGSILRKLGSGYAYDELDHTSLKHLDRYDVLFINCHGPDVSAAQRARDELRAFVERGGAVYASDYAGEFYEAAYPDAIELGTVARTGKFDAKVVDEGLQGLLGRKINLTFDTPAWQSVARAEAGARTYLRGSHPTLLGREVDEALLVSFERGAGTAVFTSFHNHKQLTDAQEKLLEFLVLRPVTARASRATIQQLQNDRMRTIRESVHKLSAGRRTEPFSFALPATPRAVLVLTPGASGASLEVSLLDPSGEVVARKVGSDGPLSVKLPAGKAKSLTYEVKALQTPYENFPFTVAIAVE